MHNKKDFKKVYEERIKTIMDYYCISKEAANYLYFRRRRSFPWCKKSDAKYLYWNARLQNALIEADNIIGFNWEALEFGDEENYLKKYDIIISEKEQNLFRENKNIDEKIYKDADGLEWTQVNNKKNKKENTQEKILQNCGLLPLKK